MDDAVIESMRGIRRLLRGVRAAWCLSAALAGGAAVAGILSTFVLCAVVLDNLFLLPGAVRWVCLGGGTVLACLAGWRGLLADLPVFAGDERLAAYFERRVPEADNQLINAVQLAAATSEGQSGAMAARFVADAVEFLGGFSGWEAFERARVLRRLKWSAGPVMALVLYAAFLWSPFSAAAYRLTHPNSTMNSVSGLRIAVAPGDATVVEGGRLEVRAEVTGGAPQSVVLEYEPQAAPEPFRVTMQRVVDEYAAGMENITAPRTYRIIAQPRKPKATMLALRRLASRPAVSRTFQVQTVPPPRIERFSISYDFPDYVGREDAVEEKDDGDIRAPVGARAILRARCNKPLREALFCLGEDEREAEVAGSEFQATLIVKASGSYHFRLTGEDGFQNVDPIAYRIVAVPDRVPKVAITAPDRDVTLDAEAILPLVFEAEDDYGLTKLDLFTKRGADGEAEVLESFLRDRDGPVARCEKAIDIGLASLDISPGHLLQVWLEATDNKPDEPNTARSRTLNVRVLGESAEEGPATEDEEERLAEEAEAGATMELEDEGEAIEDESAREQIEERLKSFVDMQRDVIEQTNNLSPKDVDDLTAEEKDAFKDVAVAEDELSKFLEELVSDLSELPKQDFTDSTLADEVVEVLAEVELAEDALELENKLMAITAEQVGLELAEELIHDLPAWLSDVPDKLKWDLEEPPEDYEVPMAELPEELTDLMGELIDEEAAMTDEVEDESSSWADSIDEGAGWATMDGPISNMSAKGKTGNLLPNSSEIGGRSGEGRTGRAHGEFVEKTAVGKGGRDTPTRLTPDPFEQGVVQDSSTDPMGGATGGGKLSGAGGDGLPGPVPPEVQHAMNRLAGKQADIRVKAQRLGFKLKVVNIPAPGLGESINMMREIEQDLRDFRYRNVLRKKDIVLKTMRESHDNMGQQIKVRGERKVALSKEAQEEVLDALDEDVLPEYEDMVADYFRALAEAR